MLSYLTDVTLFWVTSLLCYVLLLRKTTFHSLNRAVLLGTLIIGLLLPLWPAPMPETVLQMPVYHQLPTARISTVKAETLQEVSASVKPAFTFSLWTVYWVGCAVAALVYLRASGKLLRLMRKSRKCASGTAYETGLNHAPFSFAGKTFLSDCATYSPADLSLILRHEARHGRLLHTVDVLLLIVLRIVLWFHPLVYVYDFLLRQIHEFQADAFARVAPQDYGHLLLREATGNTLPIAHSFNRSPLKARILMLTRNASLPVQKLRYLLLVPIVVTAFFSCRQDEPKAITSGKPFPKIPIENDTDFVFNGNHFYRSASEPFLLDSTELMRPGLSKQDSVRMDSLARLDEAGKKSLSDSFVKMLKDFPENANGALFNQLSFHSSRRIYKVNDQPVYDENDVDVPAQYTGKSKSAYEELLTRIQPALRELPDGKYSVNVNSLVISDKGKIIYYDDQGLSRGDLKITVGEASVFSVMSSFANSVPQKVKAPVNEAIRRVLEEGIPFKPALKNGKPVNSNRIALGYEEYQPIAILVKDKHVSILLRSELSENLP